MAAETPEIEAQDVAEVFDETNLDEDAEFVTLEEMEDVFDSTSALGDARDVAALDADELDPATLDDEDLEDDEDVDDALDDDLEDRAEGDTDVDDEDVDEEDAVAQQQWDEAEVEPVADLDKVTHPDDEQVEAYESEDLSDRDVAELGYQDGRKSEKDDDGAGSGAHPDSVHIQGGDGPFHRHGKFTVDADNGAAIIRARSGGPDVRSTLIIAAETPGPQGWRAVGYEATGPRGGPLVVATVKVKSDQHDDAFDDAKRLVSRAARG